ncbi:Fc.00g080710.m01.CDS01 [Cosmosporella sp. VM-42]
MIARPVVAALSCRQCQSAIFRAVLSRPAATGFRSLPRQQARLPILTRRLFSQERQPEEATEKDTESTKLLEEAVKSKDIESSNGDVPWFLEVEPPRHAPSQHQVTLPKIPEDAPDFLEPMIKYVYEDMGLDEISLLDLRELDPPAALGPHLIMLFGTARSERHLHVSSGRFVRWLRREHDISARADGLIGPGELRTKLRRLRKKAKLMGTNTAIIPGGDNGISTGWVCVNFGSNGEGSGESVNFDESGRFSGFGATRTGTTIVIQCMTESRRQELDLENLWQGILKRSLADGKKIRGERSVGKEELNALLASKVQQPTNNSALQWQAMSRASQQHRHFSTTARRLSSVAAQEARQDVPSPQAGMGKGAENSVHDLEQIRAHIRDIQLVGTRFTHNNLLNLIKAAFQAPSTAQDAAAQRLALADELFHTAEERGMEIWSNEIFVTLIESILTSSSYGPELQQAQKNFEHLMISDGCQLDGDQVLRLMTVYAQKADWERFWDTFKIPPRSKEPREARHYELAYRVMASTGNQKQCIEAMRWVYPEMTSENPPIPPVGQLYESLKACIVVTDPEVEGLLNNPRSAEGLKLFQRRRLANREFLKILQEVEETRRQFLAHTHAQAHVRLTQQM